MRNCSAGVRGRTAKRHQGARAGQPPGAPATGRGGTTLPQNIAEAPTRVQGRLARLLRDREAIVAETGETAPFDVRPMAGVDPGFDTAVQDGRVREDLFRRLSIIRIEMPALRNRREDIPALANYFLREICAGLRLPPKTLSRSALSLLSALPWRGNGAELRRLLDSVVTGMQGGRGIALEDVLAHVRLDGGASLCSSGGTLKQARAQFEKEQHRHRPRAAPGTHQRRGAEPGHSADESLSQDAVAQGQSNAQRLASKTPRCARYRSEREPSAPDMSRWSSRKSGSTTKAA